MSDLENYFSRDQDQKTLKELYSQKVPYTVRLFTKEVEISKKDFFLLFIIISALSFLLIIQMSYDLLLADWGFIDFPFATVLNGALIGLVFSIFYSDKVHKPYIFLKYSSIIVFTSTIVETFFIVFSFHLLLNLMIFISIAILIISFVISFKLFLIKTSILERGRVWAYLFVLTLFSFLILLSLITNVFFSIIPISFVLVEIIILHKANQKNKGLFSSIKKKDKKDKSSKFKKDLWRLYFFFGFFNFTAGLATPLEGSLALITSTLGGNFAIIIMIIILSAIVASLLIGILFDFLGRIAILESIIFMLAFATYLTIFDFKMEGLPIAVVFSAYIASVIVIPLLIGDTTVRENYGSAFSISFLLNSVGVIIGLYFRISFPDQILLGSIFMSCIVCYMFLLRMHETLPRKEQEWKQFLIHLYIVHESGILLFERSFDKKKKNTSSDLISGGIIGIKSLLNEITQGGEQIRTIDHGDTILIFKFNQSKSVIFTLIVKEELIVLRNKLEQLIDEFDRIYSEEIEKISKKGINTHYFSKVKPIVKKIFI